MGHTLCNACLMLTCTIVCNVYAAALRIAYRDENLRYVIGWVLAWSAARPTAAATGFPPKVDPCWPGLMVSMISSFASTAETG